MCLCDSYMCYVWKKNNFVESQCSCSLALGLMLLHVAEQIRWPGQSVHVIWAVWNSSSRLLCWTTRQNPVFQTWAILDLTSWGCLILHSDWEARLSCSELGSSHPCLHPVHDLYCRSKSWELLSGSCELQKIVSQYVASVLYFAFSPEKALSHPCVHLVHDLYCRSNSWG